LIHLDTNIAIALLNGRPPQARTQLGAALAAATPLAMSIIAYSELQYGAAASSQRRVNEERIAFLVTGSRLTLLPFEEADAREAADIRAHLRRHATPIGPYDLLIAAQARRAGATLVTAKNGEFTRVPGLVLVDWTQ
jgi:tRNA(fMet)-specific endonuclease VapC